MAKLIEHVGQAQASRWSGIRRWQVMMRFGWKGWLIGMLGTVTLLLFFNWCTKGKINEFQLMPGILSVVLPMTALAGQLLLRKGVMGRELLLPVERGLYLRQIGAAAALWQLYFWTAVCAATLLWLLVVVPGSVPGSAIAGILVISALSQVWLFALAVRLKWHHRMMVALGVLVSGAIGLLAPIAAGGFTGENWRIEWRIAALVIVAILTVFSSFSIWTAYRRWLVTDFD